MRIAQGCPVWNMFQNVRQSPSSSILYTVVSRIIPDQISKVFQCLSQRVWSAEVEWTPNINQHTASRSSSRNSGGSAPICSDHLSPFVKLLGWPNSSPSSFRRCCVWARARTWSGHVESSERIVLQLLRTSLTSLSHFSDSLHLRLQELLGLGVERWWRSNCQAQHLALKLAHDETGLPLNNGLCHVPEQHQYIYQYIYQILSDHISTIMYHLSSIRI